MKIAVEGCSHGELDAIYTEVAAREARDNVKVSLLLLCGDFQAMRNERDLRCMAVPDKYRQLGGFWKYYTGEKKAPVLTIVIGGNHEASNYFWELYHGGWIAPNMYFLGHAGCVQVNGIRIAGTSGIFKGQDFAAGYWERLPYNPGAMRSIYHIREFSVRRLSLLSSPTVFLSHDWPQSIEQHGNVRDLLRRKPFFRDDVNTGKLGSPPLMGLLRNLKPKWWFSAHLHVRFEAAVVHQEGTKIASPPPMLETNPDEIVIEDEDDDDVVPEVKESSTVDSAAPVNPDEITLDDEEEDVEAPPPPPPPVEHIETQFLALDKCLPRRQFLEIIDIPEPPTEAPSDEPVLSYDPEWLAIVRAFNTYMSNSKQQKAYPDEAQAREAVAESLEWVKRVVVEQKGIRRVEDCQQCSVVAPPPTFKPDRGNPSYYPNPQTAAFCAMLEIENKVDAERV